MTSPQKFAAFPASSINNFKGAVPDWWGVPINTIGPRVSIVFDGFISAGSIEGWPGAVVSRVETSAGESVAESEFWRISQISKIPENLLSQRGQAKRLSGEYVYLGWLFGHYGHFLTEGLSRFWYCLDDQCPKRYLVHANYKSFSEFPQHVALTLKAFGITERNLTIVRDPVIVDKLHCPAQSIRCDYSSGQHLKNTYRHIVKSIAPRTNKPTQKIYVSRESLKGDVRSFNESEIKAVFERFGFTSIAPELLSFEKQLSVYAQSTHLVGPVGSGMHNAVFLPSGSRTLIISPNNFLFRNDSLLASAIGYHLDYFIADNGLSATVTQRSWSVDIAALTAHMDSWLQAQAK